MPMRKVGSDTPASEIASRMWERKDRGRSAVYTPIGMPAASANSAATIDSSSVAGSRSEIRRETGCTWRKLRPNSPCSALPRKRRYCTWNGWSRPSTRVTSIRCSGVASWPSMLVTGSPTKRHGENAISPTASMTRTAWAGRRRMTATILREWYPMSFAQKLIRWQRGDRRRGLPWQGTRDPYRIWLSEVMLQQTQVATVIPYYEKFIAKYPTVAALAAASEDEVLRLWAGLGYYARGRNLHKAARILKNGFPGTAAEIAQLPGIGRSTAAAIAAFAFGERAAILDGNVKRVLARCFGEAGDLWALAERLLPNKDIETYTQALMDLGATLCTRTPGCDACPVSEQCIARKEGRIHELPAPRPRKPLPLR